MVARMRSRMLSRVFGSGLRFGVAGSCWLHVNPALNCQGGSIDLFGVVWPGILKRYGEKRQRDDATDFEVSWELSAISYLLMMANGY